MNDAIQLNAALSRFVESSPAIVVLLGVIGAFIWRAWREDKKEWREMLREEREARLTSHREMVQVVAGSTLAVQAVREALLELRHAIQDKQGAK